MRPLELRDNLTETLNRAAAGERIEVTRYSGELQQRFGLALAEAPPSAEQGKPVTHLEFPAEMGDGDDSYLASIDELEWTGAVLAECAESGQPGDKITITLRHVAKENP